MAEVFAGDIQATLERWRKEAEATSTRTPHAELHALAPEYLRFRREFARERRAGHRILQQREWFRRLLPALGYACQPANYLLEDGSEAPILCAVGGTGSPGANPHLLVLGACDPDSEGKAAFRPRLPHPERVPCRSGGRLDPVPKVANQYNYSPSSALLG